VLVHNDGGDLTPQQVRSIQSYEKLIAEHQAKIDAFRADPYGFDGENSLLLRQPNPEIRQKMIDGRIAHWEKEIKAYQGNIAKIKASPGIGGIGGC